MRKPFLPLLGILFTVFVAVTLAQPPAAHAPLMNTVAATRQTAEEAALVALVNNERKRSGLPPLAVDPLLVETARAHSQEMCTKQYFSHQSPTRGLRSPLDRYLKCGGSYKNRAVIGENLYTCARVNVARSHTAFMRSPGHRANILSPEWNAIGIGIYHAPDGRFWVTQLFLLRQ
ncbi:MAG TPA: CAP domain-containing protein [Armatimonadota bacterium]|nr:CAP domain-containing protein [Armatimonadota bacterium]